MPVSVISVSACRRRRVGSSICWPRSSRPRRSMMTDRIATEGPAGEPAVQGVGRIVGDTHYFPVRVYYEDTDAGGLVFHANYLLYAERARTELLRLGGVEHRRLAAELGVFFAIRRCEIDYRAPARLDDALEVETKITDIRGASM